MRHTSRVLKNWHGILQWADERSIHHLRSGQLWTSEAGTPTILGATAPGVIRYQYWNKSWGLLDAEVNLSVQGKADRSMPPPQHQKFVSAGVQPVKQEQIGPNKPQVGWCFEGVECSIMTMFLFHKHHLNFQPPPCSGSCEPFPIWRHACGRRLLVQAAWAGRSK